jgi:hypothetical protein
VLKPYTERQKTIIINNVVKAVQDINQLNKAGYAFLCNASGFIAHYNLYGFIEYYQEHDLEQDLIHNKRQNQGSNFKPGDLNYDYYMSKADIYNKILSKI